MADLVDLWLDERAASEGLAPQTLDRYRTLVDNHIKPGVGNLRVGEATVGRFDRFLSKTAKKVPTQARHCRTILSGALAMAARYDAISVNPVRETATIAKKKNEVRALSVEELAELRGVVARWQSGLDPASGEPVKHTGRPRPTDLLDLVDVLAATGARIGEVLACAGRTSTSTRRRRPRPSAAPWSTSRVKASSGRSTPRPTPVGGPWPCPGSRWQRCGGPLTRRRRANPMWCSRPPRAPCARRPTSAANGARRGAAPGSNGSAALIPQDRGDAPGP
ncbi:MAG: hypothetical protein LBC97_07600 [Bifidobacteriaceae bacterium]|nr:hypothetical protein [Bifidobacteriaceae bacterium]